MLRWLLIRRVQSVREDVTTASVSTWDSFVTEKLIALMGPTNCDTIAVSGRTIFLLISNTRTDLRYQLSNYRLRVLALFEQER